MKYRNPVIPGFYPDPSVCRVGPFAWPKAGLLPV